MISFGSRALAADRGERAAAKVSFGSRALAADGGEKDAGESFYLTTIVHALIGVVALPFGLFVVLRGNELVPERLKFSSYKPYMRVAYGLYMLVILLGIGVYLAWFLFNPNPPVF